MAENKPFSTQRFRNELFASYIVRVFGASYKIVEPLVEFSYDEEKCELLIQGKDLDISRVLDIVESHFGGPLHCKRLGYWGFIDCGEEECRQLGNEFSIDLMLV